VPKSPAAGTTRPSAGGFAGIIGHRRLLQLLRLAVQRDRVPQSLLFAGPEGVGKRAVAMALAQAVNCPVRRAEDGDDPSTSSGSSRAQSRDDSCGTCPTCVRIARGQHTDVIVLDRGEDASIKIKPLRERLLDVVGYRPFEAARRVYIIDNADELTPEAQDALLKTLEEPPPAAIIVLVTAYPDTLRPTIQSRCRRLRFAPLTEDDLARVLVERQKIDPAKARALAATAGGSVARAMAEDEGELDDDRDAALDLLAAAQDGRVEARLKAAASLAQHGSKRRDREALGARLAVVASLVRDLTVLVTGGPSALANGDLEPALRRLSSAFTRDRLNAGFAALTEAREALDRNASPKIVADWIAVSL
jgi:DNA polymerase-3 subunit delta'